MVSFNSVSKSYGSVRALSSLSLDLHPGEVFGYVGPNGAGKTTTMKILTGLVTEYRGSVTVHGEDVRTARARTHRSIGYVPQDVGFHEWRTVGQALSTFATLSEVPEEKRSSAIARVLRLTGLEEHENRRIAHLSGGTVQRLRIAQALVHQPEIVVLDEPLSGLDPASRHQVREIIRELVAENRLVFVSSHILSELQGIATRIGILHEGAIREIGTPAELRERYKVGTAIEVTVRPGTICEWMQLTQAVITQVEEVAPDTVRLHAHADADVDEVMGTVLRGLIDMEVPVRSVRHVQPSLEDVYLQLTGGAGS